MLRKDQAEGAHAGAFRLRLSGGLFGSYLIAMRLSAALCFASLLCIAPWSSGAAQDAPRSRGLEIIAGELETICAETDWMTAEICRAIRTLLLPPDVERWRIRPSMLVFRRALRERLGAGIHQNAFYILDPLSEALMRSIAPTVETAARVRRESGAPTRVRVYDAQDSTREVLVVTGDEVRADVRFVGVLGASTPRVYRYQISVETSSPRGLDQLIVPCGFEGLAVGRASPPSSQLRLNVLEDACVFRVALAPGDSSELFIQSTALPGLRWVNAVAETPAPEWPEQSLNWSDSIEVAWIADSLRGLRERGVRGRVRMFVPIYEFESEENFLERFGALRGELAIQCAPPAVISATLCGRFGDLLTETQAAWDTARRAGPIQWDPLRLTLRRFAEAVSAATSTELSDASIWSLSALVDETRKALERRAAYP